MLVLLLLVLLVLLALLVWGHRLLLQLGCSTRVNRCAKDLSGGVVLGRVWHMHRQSILPKLLNLRRTLLLSVIAWCLSSAIQALTGQSHAKLASTRHVLLEPMLLNNLLLSLRHMILFVIGAL